MSGEADLPGALPDLSSPLRLHVVGIGGAGMSAVATVLSAMGHEVTGSDLKVSPATERLAALGIAVRIGHGPDNLQGAEAVAASSAVPDSNIELAEARRRRVPVYSRADVLASITSMRRTVAVAGTHGKTTTSSMLALVLQEAGYRPGFVIGGDLNDTGTNAAWDLGEWLVVEADESDRTFLRLRPEVAVVTSLEPDHLDRYGGFESLRGAFADYVRNASTAVLYADSEATTALAKSSTGSVLSFGLSDGASFRLAELEGARSEVSFSLSEVGTDLGRFELPVPGEHNALNAAAAIAAARLIGVGPEPARRALRRFGGVARRFEFRGARNGVTFVDDYAHLPSEVRAAIAAGKKGGFERIVAVFQPHRYTRTRSLAGDFATAFDEADVVAVTSVYSAGEPALPGVSGQLVVDVVSRANPTADIRYIPDREGLLAFLRETLRAGDLCLSLEAGDLTSLPDEMLGDAGW